MRVAELDEVTYDLEVDGEQVRRMLHRQVWERGAWATVAIAYEDRAPDGGWKPAKLAMIRLQRVRGAWQKHAAITLRGSDALELAQALASWRDAFGPASPAQPATPGVADD
ncbi:MAG TPA: hypothetical protein VHN14_02870 [Kofleriaceae bacterium]|jgi:hypothetical protein|nr:hypothetical protein [Kofleriaceae bacterium]